jgi:hypothetical protein
MGARENIETIVDLNFQVLLKGALLASLQFRFHALTILSKEYYYR